MKMYRTGYIAATIEKNNGFSYFAWPLLQIENDIIAESLTDEADDKWFTKYDMPEIAPDLEYVKRCDFRFKNIGVLNTALAPVVKNKKKKIKDYAIARESEQYKLLVKHELYIDWL